MSLGRTIFLTLAAALLGTASLSAQDPTGTVSGRVVESATQEPVPGAAVSVAARNAVSGQDGRFTITGVPAGTQTVQATRIGYGQATQQVTVQAGQTATVTLALGSQALLLEGVVAIGYGERQVRDVTGSVQGVAAEDFNTGRVVSAEQLIQGKVAGVQISDNGEPGGTNNIRIRGGTSLTASSEPLFVIDGVPIAAGGGLSAGRNPLNFLNPDDIERVTVLKDASSTAIYGSRGANGVIIIETRTGSTGPQFTYGTSFSTSRIIREPELLSADQYRAAVQQYAPERANLLGTASTDWRSAVQRNGSGQEHELAVAGSGDDMNYRLSLGWLGQEGVIRGSETERVSAALSYNHRLFSDALNVRASLRGARTDDQFVPGGVLGAANALDPTQPIQTDDGFFEWTNNNLAPNNPVAELGLAQETGTTYRSIGSLEARYRLPFVEGLSATGRLGFDVAQAERRNFYPTTQRSQLESRVACEREASDPLCPTGTLNRQNPSQVTSLLDAFLTYNHRLDGLDSDLEATAGYSYETTDRDSTWFQARGLSSDILGPNGIPSAALTQSVVDVRDSKLASFFGRLNYTLADRYLLTLSVRRDASSRFGPNNQWGTFPSAALAWRLSDEAALDRYDWLSDLKVRASWGVSGNQFFDDYRWISSYRYGDDLTQVQFGDEFVTTIRPSAVDPDIKWEETTSWNFGLDYGLWDNRVSGAVEYYVKNTDDLIFTVPVSAGTNLSNFVTTNIGSMRNQGVELSINSRVLDGARGGLTWDANFNAAYNRNRLLSLNEFGGGERVPWGAISGGVGNTIQVLQPGQSVYTFSVYRHKRGADGKPVNSDTNGNGTIELKELYENVNGDTLVNVDDRAPFENPAPDWILAHTSQFGYGSFDLSFALRAHLGNHVYNNVASNQGYYGALRGSAGLLNLHSSVLEYGFQGEQFFSDVYVEDASFLRMDNLTLGYTFSGVRGVDNARLFGTVQNVFTLTGYSGVDPEAGISGIDNNIYPRSRTFTAGISLGF